MALDLSARITRCCDAQGRVQLTTRNGAVFDAKLVRFEYEPTTAVIEPVGFSPRFGGYTAELLWLPLTQVKEVARAEGAAPAVEPERVRKAVNWPPELAPRASAAAVRKAEEALAEVGDARAIELAIAAGVTEGLAAAASRLDVATRTRLLVLAAETGAAAAIEVLLADPSAGEIDVTWLLVRAARAGKVDSVAALLAAGADVDRPVAHSPGETSSFWLAREHTPLHWGIEHRGVVRLLLAAGARVTDSARLALSLATSKDAVVWRLLVDAGLDVDARNVHDDPVILIVGRTGCTEMVRAAIDAGADVNARYPDGSTLLLHAIDLATVGPTDLTFIRELIAAGADVNAGRLNGRNPLALARLVEFDQARAIAGWLEAAGAVAVTETDAPASVRRSPIWKFMLDPSRGRGEQYVERGVRFAASAEVHVLPVETPPPRWHGHGSDDVAVVRAKLEHLFGAPHGRGDGYEVTFEYFVRATIGESVLGARVRDWQASAMVLEVEAHADEALRERVAEAFWALVTLSPIAAFRDVFRFDGAVGAAYFCDGSSVAVELT